MEILLGSDFAGLTEPVVNPKIWQNIPHQQVGQAICLANEEERGAGEQQAKVGKQNQTLVPLLVQGTARVEVVDAAVTVLAANAFAFGLARMIVVASDVGDQVVRPSEQLLGDELSGGVDGRVL